MKYNKCYDEISVGLVGVTTPVIDFIPDSEGIISYCARVSSPDNQNNFETAERLLKYCVKHKHWSVFDMVNVVMEIKAPRDIARQILRHSSNKFQEFSQRYASATEFVIRDTRLQDDKNRQNSIETDDLYLKQLWEEKQQEVIDIVNNHYNWALNAGIAKECARVILPEGNTMSTMYMNGTARSWMHYCNLRCANGTQLEHVWVAEKAKQLLTDVLPSIFAGENND